MQEIINKLQKAEEEFTKADYLISKSYDMLGETKLLIVAVKGLARSTTLMQEAVLAYERMYKRINPVVRDEVGELRKFKEVMIRRYHVRPELMMYVAEVRDIIRQHDKSSMAFVRRDKFVICSGDYRMKTLDLNLVKGYIQMHRKLMEYVTRICRKR